MQQRKIAKAGVDVPLLSFGCGGTAGLMIGNDSKRQRAIVLGAIEAGINLFDTSPSYGHGASEPNLGRALAGHRDEVLLSTKFHASAGSEAEVRAHLRRSVESSCTNLGTEVIEFLFLHSHVELGADSSSMSYGGLSHRPLTVGEILDGGIVEEVEALRARGLVRAVGFTGMGDPWAIVKLIESGAFDVVQLYVNLLNPSAAFAVPSGFRYVNYLNAASIAARHGVGVFAIRILAAGALTSGPMRRHPKDSWAGRSSHELRADRVRAGAFGFLTEDSESLQQAALRFIVGNGDVSTVVLGISRPGDVAEALRGLAAGPLDAATLERISSTYVAD